MLYVNEEALSWEESQRQLIAKDADLLHSFQVLKYINVGLLALLVYDYFLTFDLEMTRIWTLRWKLPKILFMINRYCLPPFLFFDVISNVLHVGRSCTARLVTLVFTFPAIMTVELLLVLRVLALYENSKYMARYLIIQFIAQFIMCVILSGIIMPKARSIAGQDAFTGCILSLPNGYYLTWMLLLASEIVLVVLAVYKCREYGKFSRITKILARDSIIYFISVTAMLVFNICYTRSHTLLGPTLTLPTNICASIASARLTMNVRSITMGKALESLAQQSRIVPTMLFRVPQNVGHGMEDAFQDGMELEELPRQNEDNLDQSQQKYSGEPCWTGLPSKDEISTPILPPCG